MLACRRDASLILSRTAASSAESFPSCMKQLFCCPSISAAAFSAISITAACRAISPFSSSIPRLTEICSSSPLWVISWLRAASLSSRSESSVLLPSAFSKSAWLFSSKEESSLSRPASSADASLSLASSKKASCLASSSLCAW